MRPEFGSKRRPGGRGELRVQEVAAPPEFKGMRTGMGEPAVKM